MQNLPLSAVRTTAALIAGALLSLSSAAYADDPAPAAPPNAEEAPVSAPNPGAAQLTPVTSPSSGSEPTFATETSRHTWPNTPLLATGATVFGASYLPAVAGGAFSKADGRKDLYIPVAGPWMMLTSGARESTGEKTLLIADGIAQGVGALMLLSSLFIPSRTTEHWYLIGSNDTLLTPSRVGTGYGMGARGRF